MTTKPTVFLMMTLLAGAFWLGCGGDPGPAPGEARTYPPAPAGVLRVNLGSEPPELDPGLTQDIPSFKLINQVFEPLGRLLPDGSVEPAQAHSWEHNEDYTLWTFHLRDDNQWHDGTPVTAHDFVYAVHRILNPETGARYAMMLYNFVDGGQEYYDGQIGEDELGIRAIDDHTLEIRLQTPAPFFLTMLNHTVWFPVHRGTIEEHGRNWTRPPHYIGNGPFRMEFYRSKDRAVLRRADTYWARDEVGFDEIVFRMIEEEGVELAAFISGDIDMTANVLNRDAPRWMGSPEYIASAQLGTYYVAFNTRQPPFDNRAIRKALSLTIHRQSIVDRTTRRGEQPAVGFVPRGITMPNGQDYRDLAPDLIDNADHAGNIERAKELLREAGFAVDGSPGNPLPRMLYSYNTSDLHRDVAERLQNDWGALLGANVRLENMEWTVLLERANNRDFQFIRSAWIGDYMDPLTFFEIFETGHGKNGPGYENPRYDELLAIARQETDLDTRMEAFIEMERMIVVDDAIIAPIYYYATPYLIRPEVRGARYNALGNLDLSRAYRVGERAAAAEGE